VQELADIIPMIMALTVLIVCIKKGRDEVTRRLIIREYRKRDHE